MFSKYSKALVIGAGSGRDIASSVLITEKLREQGIYVDLAGFLTPWALHEFDDKLEKPVNRLLGTPTRKFIATKEDVSLNSYFEPELIEINREFGLGIGDIYLFSLHYGTEKLRSELEGLVALNNYDLIVAVDVGGDILTLKQDLCSVFTPIVDLSCLEILADMKTTANKYLTVIAPGVDGELSSKQLTEIIGNERVLSREQITPESRNYQTFVRVYDEINRRTNSSSHTGDVIKKIVEGKSDFTEEYQRCLGVHDRSWDVSFTVQLKRELAREIYYFDLETVKSQRRDICVSYENILQAYMQMKEMGSSGTEIDLTYVPRRIKNGDYSDCIFVLDPFSRASKNQRKELVEYGLSRIKEIGAVLVPENYLGAALADGTTYEGLSNTRKLPETKKSSY